MRAKASGLGFLDLPVSIRKKIYAHILLPCREDDVTTINYTLDWPYLDNPSNTTFAGLTQIDPCTCPRAYPESENHQHIYTRYKCVGPEVHFKSPSEGLWVLQAAHGQFNILRPAVDEELDARPSLAILQTAKQIHDEALPFLYRERDFLLTTGPCPRGRYQSYATLQWLKQLTDEARANVEILSLLVQPYEEDCDMADVEEAYAEFGAYIQDHLPGFKWLFLGVGDPAVYQTAGVFLRLIDKKGVGIVARQPWCDEPAEVYTSKKSFLDSFGEAGK